MSGVNTFGAYRDHLQRGMSWREAGSVSESASGSGSDTPIVFLHGLGGTRIAWGPQLRDLSSSFRCIAWNMPGYGDSDPIEPLTFEAIAARVVDLLDLVEVDSADLVGLSFGGMHALHTAHKFPDRVRRLVLADTSPAFGLDGTTRDDWVRSRLSLLDDGDTLADGAAQLIDTITTVRLEGQVREETVGAFGQISSDGFQAAVNCLPDHDIRADATEIRQPSLVIVGEHDHETPVSYAKALTDLLPHARLEVLAGVGHLSPAEAPDRFNRLVADFLTSSDPAPKAPHDQ